MRCSRALLPARGLSSFFAVKPDTPTRSHPYVLRPPHPPVHTKLCREQTDAYPLPARSDDKCRYPPRPQPRGPRPPARRALHNTSSSRRRRHSPPRARDACPHAHKDHTLSHMRSLYTHILYADALPYLCCGSTFVWARRMRHGGDGGNTMTVSARGRTPVMADSEHGLWCSGGEA